MECDKRNQKRKGVFGIEFFSLVNCVALCYRNTGYAEALE